MSPNSISFFLQKHHFLIVRSRFGYDGLHDNWRCQGYVNFGHLTNLFWNMGYLTTRNTPTLFTLNWLEEKLKWKGYFPSDGRTDKCPKFPTTSNILAVMPQQSRLRLFSLAVFCKLCPSETHRNLAPHAVSISSIIKIYLPYQQLNNFRYIFKICRAIFF